MPDDQVVQVRIAGGPSRTYAYTWSGAPLAEGDWVALPENVAGSGGAGRVEGFGRDGYGGPLRELLHRIPDLGPFFRRMRAAADRDEASAVWRDALREDMPESVMDHLAGLGRKRMTELIKEEQ